MTTASHPQSSPHPFRWAVVSLGLVTLAFAGLTDNVVDHDGLTRLDRPWHQWVVAHRSAGLTHVMTALSAVGGTAELAVLAVVVAGWLLLRRRWAEALLIGVTTAGAGLLVPLVKNLVDRPRPPVADRLLVETSWSYPSGHSLGATAVLGVLTFLLVRRLTGRAVKVAAGAAGVLLVVAIGLSRVYLGVHWPSDVLAGWLLGGLWLGCAVLSLRTPRLPESSQIPHQD